MLPPHSLPPHFLLPAWGTRQLLRALQRAHQSTNTRPEEPNPSRSQIDDERRRKVIPSIRLGPVNPTVIATAAAWATDRRSSQRPLRQAQLDDEQNHEGRLPIRRFMTAKGGLSPSLQKGPSRSQTSKQPGRNGTSSLPPAETQATSSLPNDKSSGQDTPSKHRSRQKPIRSLFDELFPEESKSAKQKEEKTVDKLPIFNWVAGSKLDWEETVNKAAEERKNWFRTIPESKTRSTNEKAEVQRTKRDGTVGVLVLSSASKTLEQSDFFRLGEKGEHIEGWTSGIVKVIQSRDSQTLDPLGRYFLIFSNNTAASAYLDQMLRLHSLSGKYSGRESPISLPSKFLRPGEDMKTVLRGYSLVPGQGKLFLRLLDKPYNPAVTQVLNNGGPAAIAKQRTNSEDLVLLSLDLGPVSWQEVRSAINADGKTRNLHWQLSEGDGAILKVDSGRWMEEDELSSDSRHGRSARRSSRGPAKFIVSFKDSHEARRFVREWHRRPFPTQKEQRLGDEPPPMINAQMFW